MKSVEVSAGLLEMAENLPNVELKEAENVPESADAERVMESMIQEATRITKELGKVDDFTEQEANELYEMIGMGALKYFILKVDPEKRMLFNPEESIDFNGNTGPFIQYTYARIRSVIRKANKTASIKLEESYSSADYAAMNEKEKELVKQMLKFPFVLGEAADRYSPAVMANYVYELAKTFNQFYHEFPIVDEAAIPTSKFRLQLCDQTSKTIKRTMSILGIGVPDRM